MEQPRTMNDLEVAVAHFLPDIWTPGKRHKIEGASMQSPDGTWEPLTSIPAKCPEPTWEIAGQLLKAIQAQSIHVIAGLSLEAGEWQVDFGVWGLVAETCTAKSADLKEAIFAAAATWARKVPQHE